METGFLHTHTLMVSLYLFQLGVKFVLLLLGNIEGLEKFSARTRYPSIAVSVFMLGTGIFLMVRSPEGTQPYIWVKLGLLAASIPLGIVGFKRKNTLLAFLSFAMIVATMIIAYAKPNALRNTNSKEVGADAGEEKKVIEAGRLVYDQKCSLCHGADGTKGFQGAKNLKASVMPDAEITSLIRNGKNMMPADKDLSDEEVKQVIAYVKYLRN